MASLTHWIEIDLLRAGERPPEVRGQSAYYALLRRGEADAPYAVWKAALRQRLPVIGVPTRAPRPDLGLDLQALIESVYTRGVYEASIDYDDPAPPPPLSPEDALWLQEMVRAWRQRRAASS